MVLVSWQFNYWALILRQYFIRSPFLNSEDSELNFLDTSYTFRKSKHNDSKFAYSLNSIKSLSEKWLPAVTFTIGNIQNRNGYSDIITYCDFSTCIADFSDRL
ncbi:MAG: hypothetical protein QG646_1145 [Euryarchaeota archaeon]|nr:hypothetical protein [Euryarchaeota archaeon]